jgi:hypothetical protein
MSREPETGRDGMATVAGTTTGSGGRIDSAGTTGSGGRIDSAGTTGSGGALAAAWRRLVLFLARRRSLLAQKSSEGASLLKKGLVEKALAFTGSRSPSSSIGCRQARQRSSAPPICPSSAEHSQFGQR